MTSLYLHLPWCVRKCPYCDFNAHEGGSADLYQEYQQALIKDFTFEQQLFANTSVSVIETLFIGGGTPSLMTGQWYEDLFASLQKVMPFAHTIEASIEANPGTIERDSFSAYKAAGLNRVSLGVQSFDATQLTTLGRIHSASQAKNAFMEARNAGFDRINIDLMFGLPNQTVTAGLDDLQQAIDFDPEHISWYQLTIEPNTVFYSNPPLIDADISGELWLEGCKLLQDAGYIQYEVSAFAKPGEECRHNVNYWQFNDYLAIGAGAHGKWTDNNGQVLRYQKTRMPAHFIDRSQRIPTSDAVNPFIAQQSFLTTHELYTEFLLNRLRLFKPLDSAEFELKTQMPWAKFLHKAKPLVDLNLLIHDTHQQSLTLTPMGQGFLNDVLCRLTA